MFDKLTTELLDLTVTVQGRPAGAFAMLAVCCCSSCSCGGRGSPEPDDAASGPLARGTASSRTATGSCSSTGGRSSSSRAALCGPCCRVAAAARRLANDREFVDRLGPRRPRPSVRHSTCWRRTDCSSRAAHLTGGPARRRSPRFGLAPSVASERLRSAPVGVVGGARRRRDARLLQLTASARSAGSAGMSGVDLAVVAPAPAKSPGSTNGIGALDRSVRWFGAPFDGLSSGRPARGSR